MMDSADSQTYALRFKRWQEDVLQHNLPQFIRLMNTMIEWKHEIVAAIETGYSNGYIEGCNNRTKVLKRTCYGLRNFERMRNRILYLAVTKNRQQREFASSLPTLLYAFTPTIDIEPKEITFDLNNNKGCLYGSCLKLPNSLV